MDTLKDKKYEAYSYTCRYTNVPYFYDTLRDREVYGIGTNMKKNTSYFSHKVTDEDTLDKLALKYYNNPTYWWIIAYFNDIQDAFIRLRDYYTVIKIPSIVSIEFGEYR